MPQPYSDLMEIATNDLSAAFDFSVPPVPVEIMLQRPKPDMWQQVHLSDLSTAFINVRERYSPRMSIARLLVRYICRSMWGTNRGLSDFISDEQAIRAFARTLLMPRQMIALLDDTEREPIVISSTFEVPEEDARLRLVDLGLLLEQQSSRPSTFN